MRRRVVLVRTDFSEERIASIIRVKLISELGTTLAITSVTFQKTAFFMVTAVKPSYLTLLLFFTENLQYTRFVEDILFLNMVFIRQVD
jgi:hypothetical protein